MRVVLCAGGMPPRVLVAFFVAGILFAKQRYHHAVFFLQRLGDPSCAELALRKRGADAVVQVVTIVQFRDHMQRRDPSPATLAELLRCATNLARGLKPL